MVAEGTPAQLKHRIAGARLDLTLADRAAFETVARELGERVIRSDPSELTIAVAADGSAAQTRALLDELDPTRQAITTFAVQTATLDDVFLALTGHTAVHPEPELAHV